MAVAEVLGRQRIQLGNVLMQHCLGQVIDGFCHVLVRGRWAGCDVAAEQAQKTNQHLCFFHEGSLLL
ncbi:hypothetical protein D3C84_1245610 [compost metagenome]